MAMYGFDDSSWSEDLREGVTALAKNALAGESITYKQFAESISSKHYHYAHMSNFLNRIVRATKDASGCIITSIIVRKDDGRPGTGFETIARWADAASRKSDPEKYWLDQVAKTQDYFREVSEYER